jgi:hypothetical protein
MSCFSSSSYIQPVISYCLLYSDITWVTVTDASDILSFNSSVDVGSEEYSSSLPNPHLQKASHELISGEREGRLIDHPLLFH